METTLKIKSIKAKYHLTATQKKQIKAGLQAGYEVFNSRDYVYEITERGSDFIDMVAKEKRGSLNWNGGRDAPTKQPFRVNLK